MLSNLAGLLLSFNQLGNARQSLQKGLVYATELAKQNKDNRSLLFLQESTGSSAFYSSAYQSGKEKKKKIEYYMNTESGDRYLVGNLKLQEQDRLLYADSLNNMAILLEYQ